MNIMSSYFQSYSFPIWLINTNLLSSLFLSIPIVLKKKNLVKIEATIISNEFSINYWLNFASFKCYFSFFYSKR